MIFTETFNDHTHLIIDEVHERSVDGDLLCLLARRYNLTLSPAQSLFSLLSPPYLSFLSISLSPPFSSFYFLFLRILLQLRLNILYNLPEFQNAAFSFTLHTF